MPRLKRKDIPTEVKTFLKDPNVFDPKEEYFFHSLAKQLKSKNWMSDTQVQKIQDHLINLKNQENACET